ncbi:MAG TPA: hypothetical protein VGJ70_16140, partial [Solirubrobacteraceae bacterium]
MLDAPLARTVAALSAILAVVLAAAPTAQAGARRLSVAPRLSPPSLVSPGLGVRVTVGRGDHVVRVRLQRVSGRRIVAARYLRVRAGRRQLVRWRLGAVTAGRLRTGRYRVTVRAGRRRGRLTGRTVTAIVRIAPRRVAPSPPATPPPAPAPTPTPAPVP